MEFKEVNKTLTNPFGVNVKVQYISKEKGAENIQLGTYGTLNLSRLTPYEC